MPRQPASVDRRGGVYVAVLGAAMIVSLIGLTALAAVRAQRLTVRATTDTAQAELNAQSAVELAMQWIAVDANWRQNRGSGAWVTDMKIGDGSLSISATDPTDGNITNRPYDSVVVRGTGVRGSATQIVEATAVAAGTPLDALAMAVHTAGELRINSGCTLSVSGAPASTNTTLRDDGIVAGDAHCLAATMPLNVTGTLTLLAPTKAMPSAGVVPMYANLGAAISPGSTMDRSVLGPGINPWGQANAEGVYVITTSADLTIRRSRICGTLVVICPGRKVTIQDNVLLQPARSDYPSLIVDGNLVLSYASSGSLSESAEGTNFNPGGAPYQGATDSDQSDSYPSEIHGLVHARGTLSITTNITLRGGVICESAAATNAVQLSSSAQIVYDPQLYSSPPMGYTKSVTMSIKPGTWKRVVLP